MRPYEPVSALWLAQWSLLFGSWLVFPLLLWWLHRLRRDWRSMPAGARWRRGAWIALALLFIDMRFVEPALIVERTTTLELGFRARVAVISDHHLGLYKGPAFLDRVVARLNALDVDAVLIAGDHTYEPDRSLRELLAPFAKLRHAAFSVPGNHDEQRPGPPIVDALREALQAHRVTPVEYRHAGIGGFTVVGLGDRFAGKDDLAPLAAAPVDRPRIVLVHNPDSAMHVPKGAAALVVAGHTHGGQIRIPWLYRRVIPCRYPFDRGLHDFAPNPVFVTSGLGEVFLPMRLFNPPVIDVLEIR